MKFGRVIGTVVASQKYEGLEGVKLLVVQPLTRDLEPAGRPEIAADGTAQAGPGELVFMVASREGAQAMPELFVPVDLAITGIVDEVDVETGPRRDQPTAVWNLPKKMKSNKKTEKGS
ncbi:MAG: EutN/CcmL family microcompartment protein [Anaerolineales bacterium]|nr:EutN/CcmL family microcompartment protein [Anaerolineales bacterium]